VKILLVDHSLSLAIAHSGSLLSQPFSSGSLLRFNVAALVAYTIVASRSVRTRGAHCIHVWGPMHNLHVGPQ